MPRAFACGSARFFFNLRKGTKAPIRKQLTGMQARVPAPHDEIVRDSMAPFRCNEIYAGRDGTFISVATASDLIRRVSCYPQNPA